MQQLRLVFGVRLQVRRGAKVLIGRFKLSSVVGWRVPRIVVGGTGDPSFVFIAWLLPIGGKGGFVTF